MAKVIEGNLIAKGKRLQLSHRALTILSLRSWCPGASTPWCVMAPMRKILPWCGFREPLRSR